MTFSLPLFLPASVLRPLQIHIHWSRLTLAPATCLCKSHFNKLALRQFSFTFSPLGRGAGPRPRPSTLGVPERYEKNPN